MPNTHKNPLSITNTVPFSLAAANEIQGEHPLRIYYLNHRGQQHQAVLWSSDGLQPAARAACAAYVQALGGELLDVHAELKAA